LRPAQRRIRPALPRKPADPIDDLIYVLLSNQTPLERAKEVYDVLKDEYPSWTGVLEDEKNRLRELFRPAGFANRRTRQIREAVATILEDIGNLRSPALWDRSTDALLDYLTSLRGVSDKVARCVMTYSLGRDVLPVDVHVHRVARRLGWTSRERPG
jgi:endonuclease III